MDRDEHGRTRTDTDGQEPVAAGSWIWTIGGRRFELASPTAEMVNVGEIGHALARLCRFVGHIRPQMYSVAQHCLEVSQRCPTGMEGWGLMHDAAEAYVGDISGPLKALVPAVCEVEERILGVIAGVVGLEMPVPEEVKVVDRRMLLTEMREFRSARQAAVLAEAWGLEPYESGLITWQAGLARALWMERFREVVQR